MDKETIETVQWEYSRGTPISCISSMFKLSIDEVCSVIYQHNNEINASVNKTKQNRSELNNKDFEVIIKALRTEYCALFNGYKYVEEYTPEHIPKLKEKMKEVHTLIAKLDPEF